MNVTYPLFVFEKDDHSMSLIEDSTRILYHLEPIDIENEEYLFWDAKGNGISVSVVKNKNVNVDACSSAFGLKDAFAQHVNSLELGEISLEGDPMEVWQRIRAATEIRRKKRGFLSNLFPK